jgi:ammonia channel protein AmtB
MVELLGNHKFDGTLGAVFLGNLAAAMYVTTLIESGGVIFMPRQFMDSLYGITCVQIYVYFRKNYQDPLTLKLLVCTCY